MSELSTEISHQEFIRAWAPLMDVSIALDKVLQDAGDCPDSYFLYLDDKVKRALEPLTESLNRIQEENPDHFK